MSPLSLGERATVLEVKRRSGVHRVHRRWDRVKYPTCGLVDAALTRSAAQARLAHGGLQSVLCLTIALRMTMSLRMQAVSACGRALPVARRRW
jgi:hypothetical protein